MRIGILKMSPQFESVKEMMDCFNKNFKVLQREVDINKIITTLCESELFEEHDLTKPIKQYMVWFKDEEDKTVSISNIESV